MNISVFGLGYVGCVGIGCLSEMGHKLIGVDVEPIKVDLINKGMSTIVEKGIDELIERNFKAERIVATLDSQMAIMESDVAIICVGTPNDPTGHLNMNYIRNVAEEIGNTLRLKKTFLTVAIRSTVMPGTNKIVTEIIEKRSGKTNRVDFAVVSNPEFLREGVAIEDFYNPPYTVLASESEAGIEIMKSVYADVNAEFVIPDIGSAEMIKLVNNSFHALKVTFANEIGRICKSINVDSHSLMDMFIRDKRLNISPVYFKPGFAYGGSCLPKDLKALNTIAHDNYVEIPVISSIDISNQRHIEYALNIVLKKNKRKIGLYGISFKPGTDDLRFSPALEIAERLIGKGYDVRIYDKNINLSYLMGKNKEYIFSKLPHINKLLYNDFNSFIDASEIIIVSTYDKNITEFIGKEINGKEVVDFVRIEKNKIIREKYEGICW